MDLLAEIRKNLSENLALITDNELKSEAAYTVDMANSENKIA
jgi:hypothetical protein